VNKSDGSLLTASINIFFPFVVLLCKTAAGARGWELAGYPARTWLQILEWQFSACGGQDWSGASTAHQCGAMTPHDGVTDCVQGWPAASQLSQAWMFEDYNKEDLLHIMKEAAKRKVCMPIFLSSVTCNMRVVCPVVCGEFRCCNLRQSYNLQMHVFARVSPFILQLFMHDPPDLTLSYCPKNLDLIYLYA